MYLYSMPPSDDVKMFACLFILFIMSVCLSLFHTETCADQTALKKQSVYQSVINQCTEFFCQQSF